MLVHKIYFLMIHEETEAPMDHHVWKKLPKKWTSMDCCETCIFTHIVLYDWFVRKWPGNLFMTCTRRFWAKKLGFWVRVGAPKKFLVFYIFWILVYFWKNRFFFSKMAWPLIGVFIRPWEENFKIKGRGLLVPQKAPFEKYLKKSTLAHHDTVTVWYIVLPTWPGQTYDPWPDTV